MCHWKGWIKEIGPWSGEKERYVDSDGDSGGDRARGRGVGDSRKDASGQTSLPSFEFGDAL